MDLDYNYNVFYNAGTAGDGIKVTFGDSVEKIPAYLFYTSNSSYSPKITSVAIGKTKCSLQKARCELRLTYSFFKFLSFIIQIKLFLS